MLLDIQGKVIFNYDAILAVDARHVPAIYDPLRGNATVAIVAERYPVVFSGVTVIEQERHVLRFVSGVSVEDTEHWLGHVVEGLARVTTKRLIDKNLLDLVPGSTRPPSTASTPPVSGLAAPQVNNANAAGMVSVYSPADTPQYKHAAGMLVVSVVWGQFSQELRRRCSPPFPLRLPMGGLVDTGLAPSTDFGALPIVRVRELPLPLCQPAAVAIILEDIEADDAGHQEDVIMMLRHAGWCIKGEAGWELDV